MKKNLMNLVTYPSPILSKKCAEVKIGDMQAGEILGNMTDKLYEWNGAGLAAPQVGILQRIVVIDVREDPATLYRMINPRIVWRSEELVESKEGCLSIPRLLEKVPRHELVTVQYFDENFAEKEVYASGFLSCCLQHELDHLDGILYIDRLGRRKRSMAIQKFKKLQEEFEEKRKEEEMTE
ncbi:MAG: peptide deformylase [Holosporaceae bacterium]|jgi:peptide deformylase|nr:peptide deformylase [Holosporaceae bacterium]